jgi:methyl-accepting chemotaxis protein I, serine sensor receptor
MSERDFDTASAHDDFGLDARTINFDAGTTNLTAITAKPLTSLTGAQITRNAQSAQAELLSQQAQQAANARALPGGYNETQGQARAANAELLNVSATIPGISKARIDWGLLPAGVAVLATGAALIASGGTLAGALAAPVSVGAAGGTAAAVSTAVTADKLLATIQKGGEVAKDAKAVIDNTKALAKAGNTDAQQAAKIVEDVAADRLAKGVPAGVEQQVTADAQALFQTVPTVIAVKDAVTGIASTAKTAAAAVRGVVPSALPVVSAAAGQYPSSGNTGPGLAVPAPASVIPSAAVVAARAVGAPTRIPAAASALPAPSSAVASDSKGVNPRWLVTDAGQVFRAQGQPVTARGYLVFDDGRVVHQ